MATFTGQTKSANIVLTPMTKAGSGWAYDRADITYDGEFDPQGRRVTYDGVGTLPVFSGQSKSATITLTAQAKS